MHPRPTAPTSRAAAPIVLRSTWPASPCAAPTRGGHQGNALGRPPSHSLQSMVTDDVRASGGGIHDDRPQVWLPIPADEIEGLPDGLDYVFWDGAEDYPADPALARFY